jgi:hypothetical protein
MLMMGNMFGGEDVEGMEELLQVEMEGMELEGDE